MIQSVIQLSRQVVKCWRLTYEDGSADANGRGASGGRPMPKLNRVEIVALKILKCHPSYERQAQTEAAVLGRLSREGIAGRFNVVQPHEFFRHKGHSCLVFEGLDINLYEYLKINQFKPVQLEHVRMIAHQVCLVFVLVFFSTFTLDKDFLVIVIFLQCNGCSYNHDSVPNRDWY